MNDSEAQSASLAFPMRFQRRRPGGSYGPGTPRTRQAEAGGTRGSGPVVAAGSLVQSLCGGRATSQLSGPDLTCSKRMVRGFCSDQTGEGVGSGVQTDIAPPGIFHFCFKKPGTTQETVSKRLNWLPGRLPPVPPERCGLP